MPLSSRLLVPGDEARVDNFLKPHTSRAFFIRSNLAKGGLVYEGKPFQAEFFGAFDSENLVGVLIHGWIGNMQVFVSDLSAIPVLAEGWQKYRAGKPHEIECFLGPADQVSALLSALGIEPSLLHFWGETEGLFTLSLDKLKSPPELKNLDLTVRYAEKKDADTLIAWRHDFNVEANNATPGQITFDKAKEEISRRIDDKDLFVLDDQGILVSFCGVGGFLPDWTNVGPLWTPLDRRNKGYGRIVLAGALAMMRDKGLTNAVLFARLPAAIKVYHSLGFERTCDWRFDVLKAPLLIP